MSGHVETVQVGGEAHHFIFLVLCLEIEEFHLGLETPSLFSKVFVFELLLFELVYGQLRTQGLKCK